MKSKTPSNSLDNNRNRKSSSMGSRKIGSNPASPSRVDRTWKTRRDSRVHPTAVRRIATRARASLIGRETAKHPKRLCLAQQLHQDGASPPRLNLKERHYEQDEQVSEVGT